MRRFLLEKAFLILSNQHWLRSWLNRRGDSLNVTVVGATLSWAVLVDALCLKLLCWISPHNATRWVSLRGCCFCNTKRLQSVLKKSCSFSIITVLKPIKRLVKIKSYINRFLCIIMVDLICKRLPSSLRNSAFVYLKPNFVNFFYGLTVQ